MSDTTHGPGRRSASDGRRCPPELGTGHGTNGFVAVGPILPAVIVNAAHGRTAH